MPSPHVPPPYDASNAELAARVHPSGWRNPEAAGIYNLVVIGGGTAGLVAAVGAAGLGARVALVERHLLGGDCLVTGCVPSKAIIRSARVVGELRRAHELGITVRGADVDVAAVMRRMRERRATIARHDSAERIASLGVDVFFGEARFTGRRTIEAAGQTLRFSRAVIATGGRPSAPPIPGLDSVPFLTNETVFTLTALPARLVILGGGPIGCELAQTFARLGSEITILDQSPRLLSRDDARAAALLAATLTDEGVSLELGASVERVRQDADDIVVQWRRDEGAAQETRASALLVAAGRTPNVEGLDCAAAGIAVDRDRVRVNDRLQTTNRRVFASGDVCSAFKFTHAADAMSRLVIRNALFFGRGKASDLVIPWVTYTDPEIAHVGVTDADVARSNGRYQTITIDLDDVDRAVVDDDTEGFVRVHHEGGKLRGCTVVAPHAGEMIGEAAYVLTRGGSLASLSSTIHPYPTIAEALRKAGDAYRRQLLTPTVRRWLGRYFTLTR